MERCSPNVPKKVMRRLVTGSLLVALCSAATGCVLGNDSDPPVLSVNLLWDRSTQSKFFSEGTCESAGVVSMDWQLKDANDHVVTTSDDQGQECRDGFDFVDVGPGTYSLTASGYDDNDQQLWSSTCKQLEVQRFDVLFDCKIDKTDKPQP